jgi:hypothetical protein
VTEKCSGSAPAWTHIPQIALTILSDAYAAWYTAFSKMHGPHTNVDTEAKDDAKAAAKAIVRSFIKQYLRFPPVTNEDRTAIGRNDDYHRIFLHFPPAPPPAAPLTGKNPHPRRFFPLPYPPPGTAYGERLSGPLPKKEMHLPCSSLLNLLPVLRLVSFFTCGPKIRFAFAVKYSSVRRLITLIGRVYGRVRSSGGG